MRGIVWKRQIIKKNEGITQPNAVFGSVVTILSFTL